MDMKKMSAMYKETESIGGSKNMKQMIKEKIKKKLKSKMSYPSGKSSLKGKD